MKKTLNFLLLCFALFQLTFSVNAKTTNLLFQESPEQSFGSANPVLLGNQIIYQSIKDGESSIWAYNTLTSENTQIFTGQLSRFFFEHYIYVINNHAYFVSGSDSRFQFWKTDGSAAGTVQLSSPSLYPVHSQIDDLMFAWSNDGGLLSTDGTEVIEHDIVNPKIDNICAFDHDDVIATKDGLSNVGDAILIRSRNGVISTLSEGYPEIFEIRSHNSFKVGDQCYLLINGFEGFKELLVVSKNGSISSISELFDISPIVSIFNFKERIYAVTRSDVNVYSLQRFNQNMNGFDATYSYSQGLSTGGTTTSSEYIISRSTTPNISPPVSFLTYLDQNLSPIEGLGGFNVNAPGVYPSANGDLFTRASYTGNAYTHTLSDEANFDSPNNLNTTTAIVDRVITSNSNSDIYLMLRDKITGQKSVAEVADVPNINPSTAGLWFNPDINNQGLVINQGQRADGSEYLFVTAYTFIEGEPFWLAGVADINPPQQSIELEMFQYSGGEFLQTDTPTDADSWGQLELEMTSCNGLKASLNGADSSSYVINLIRIDNTLFENICTD